MTRAAAAVLLALAAAGCASAPASVPGAPGGDPVDEGMYGGAYDGEYGAPRRRRTWEDVERFHTTLMPYAWRAVGSGDSIVRDVPVRFDEADGPDDSDLSWGGRAEVYSERVGFFLDGFYTKISGNDSGTEYDDRYAVFDLGTAMRIAGGDPWEMTGERPPVDLELDGLALLRTHWLKMDAMPAGAYTAASDDALWCDFVVGARGALVVAGRLSLFGRIDGGGMAVNQWRSWTWSGEVGAKLRVTRNLGAVAAWRWFESHWEDGTPEEVVTPYGTDSIDSTRDVRLQGPWVGIVLEF